MNPYTKTHLCQLFIRLWLRLPTQILRERNTLQQTRLRNDMEMNVGYKLERQLSIILRSQFLFSSAVHDLDKWITSPVEDYNPVPQWLLLFSCSVAISPWGIHLEPRATYRNGTLERSKCGLLIMDLLTMIVWWVLAASCMESRQAHLYPRTHNYQSFDVSFSLTAFRIYIARTWDQSPKSYDLEHRLHIKMRQKSGYNNNTRGLPLIILQKRHLGYIQVSAVVTFHRQLQKLTGRQDSPWNICPLTSSAEAVIYTKYQWCIRMFRTPVP